MLAPTEDAPYAEPSYTHLPWTVHTYLESKPYSMHTYLGITQLDFCINMFRMAQLERHYLPLEGPKLHALMLHSQKSMGWPTCDISRIQSVGCCGIPGQK